MGCTSSRSGKTNSILSTECDSLIQSNLSLLQILEFVFITKRKLNSALSILYLSKCCEQYYKLIKTYRNYWLSEAKSSLDESTLSRKLEKCEQEQIKEKNQLVNCYETLLALVSELTPEWKSAHESISDYLEDLEQSPSVTQASTTLYGNFYMASKQEIKEAVAEYGELSKEDKETIQKVKKVAINPYKDTRSCVYFTEKIVISKRKRKSLALNPIHMKRESSKVSEIRNQVFIDGIDKKNESIDKKVETVDKIEKSDEQMTSEKVTKVETETSTKNEIAQANEDSSESFSESFYETDEDEEYLARLSVSQK